MNHPVWTPLYRPGQPRRPVWWAGLAAFTLVACASTPPPTAQLAVSTAAVAHAAGAGGNEWAPAQMQLAQDKLSQASAAAARDDPAKALALAEQAQVDAQLAEARAHAAKARKAAEGLREGDRVLREELDRKARATPVPNQTPMPMPMQAPMPMPTPR